MNQYPLIRGQTDLKARNPALAEEWDGIRNKGLTPEDVQPGSVKKSTLSTGAIMLRSTSVKLCHRLKW